MRPVSARGVVYTVAAVSEACLHKAVQGEGFAGACSSTMGTFKLQGRF